MKKSIFSIWLIMLSMTATAQSFVVVDKQGNRIAYDVSKLESVTFQQNPDGFTVHDNAEKSKGKEEEDGSEGGQQGETPQEEITTTSTLYTFDEVQSFSGEPQYLFVHPDTVYIGSETETFTFQLNTNVEYVSCEKYRLPSERPWLHYHSIVSGSDSLRFEAVMNPSTTKRSAYIIFTNKANATQCDTLVVVQAGKRDSRYIDIDWTKTTLESYNKETGRAVLTFQDEVPVMGKYDVTLLPSNDTYSIRLIDDVQQLADNKVQLDTREGKMGNLFKDQQFTLCSDPTYDPTDNGSSSSGTTPKSKAPAISGSIIYPDEIYLCEEGKPVMEVYNKARAQRRAQLEKEYNLFEYKYDNSGTVIWEKGANKVSWNTCTFDIGLKGVFSFDFGDTEWEEVRFGDLQNFKAYLDGDFNTDLILQYELTKGVEASYEKTLKEDIFSYRVKFMVGTIPVWINLSSDLKASVEAKAEGTVTVTGGVRASANLKGGIEWDTNRGVNPISSFDYQYELVSPEVTAEAHAEAKAYVWPEINIGIYDVLCPTINPKPYIRAYADARTAEGNKPFFGWNAGISTGVDLTLGLNLDLYFWKKEIGEIEPINLIDRDLVAVPTKIELEGDTISRVLNGTTHEVKYKVKGYNSITGSEYLIPGALVKIENLGGGEIDSEQWRGSDYFYSNWDGEVIVKYTQTDFVPGYLKATLITGDEERDKECRNWHSEVVDFRLTAIAADNNTISATRAGKAEVEFLLEEYTKKKADEDGYWTEAYGYKVGFSATGGKLDADTLITDQYGKVVVNFDGSEDFSGGSLNASALIQEFDTLFTQEVSIKKFSFDDPGLAKCYNLPNNMLSFDGGYLPVVSKTILEWKKDDSEYVVWSPPGYFSFFWEAEKAATGKDVRDYKWEHVMKGAGGSHSIEAEVIFDNKTNYDADYQTQHPNRGYWQVPYAGAKYTAYTEWKEVEGWEEHYQDYYEEYGEYPDIPVPNFDSWSTNTDGTAGGKHGVLRFTTAVTGGSGKQILFEEGDTYVFLLYRVQNNGDSVYLKLVFNKSEVIDQGIAY